MWELAKRDTGVWTILTYALVRGDHQWLVLGYKCGHKNVESVKLKARKDVSNIEQAVYRRIQSDGR